MPAKTPFALHRATKKDFPDIARLMYRCFPPDLTEILTGMKSEADYHMLVERFNQEVDTCNDLFWIKVVDQESGKIIAASEWRIKLAYGPEQPFVEPPENIEGELRERSHLFHKVLNGERAKAMKGPFIYLHLCFTDADYRRRGAGSMMIQWGVDTADQLQIPGWIEATKDGDGLYKCFGYYGFEEVSYAGFELLNMKRNAKTTPILGGK